MGRATKVVVCDHAVPRRRASEFKKISYLYLLRDSPGQAVA